MSTTHPTSTDAYRGQGPTAAAGYCHEVASGRGCTVTPGQSPDPAQVCQRCGGDMDTPAT